jgi:myxalamid-type polyketide synthase MxaE and MxaD
VLDELAAAAAEERPALVRAAVRRVAGRVLKLREERIDDAQPLGDLGLDSLMGVELRNGLEAQFRLKLPATLAWNYPTVQAIAAHVLMKLDPNAAVAAPVAEPADPSSSSVTALLTATADLADDDIVRALRERTLR